MYLCLRNRVYVGVRDKECVWGSVFEREREREKEGKGKVLSLKFVARNCLRLEGNLMLRQIDRPRSQKNIRSIEISFTALS